MDIEPASAERFDAIHGVLREAFGSGLAKDTWRRIVDYEFSSDEVASRERGWVLVDDGDVVGFLGAIYSERGGERFCNVTGWGVKKSHRRSALKLLAPVFEMRDRTILNLSATPFTVSVFKRMGFTELERCVVLVPPSLRATTRKDLRFVSDPTEVRDLLTPADRRIFDDHWRYPCTHLVVAGANEYLYVVAAKTKFRRSPATYYYHRSNEALFRELVGPIQRKLSVEHRTPFGVVDARLLGDAPPRGTYTYTLRQPRLYRPATRARIEREDIDGLYSELVLLDPRRWTFNY